MRPDRRTIKSAVVRVFDASGLQVMKGTWAVRIGDDREKVTRRKRKTGTARSRSQATMTWVLLQLHKSLAAGTALFQQSPL